MKQLNYQPIVAVATLPSPVAGLAGVTVRLTTDGKPYYCNGTSWVDLSAGRNITVSSIAPLNPSVNDLWIQI